MEKTIKIGEIEVPMKATANTPKRYRQEYNKDLIIEMQRLYNHLDTKTGSFTGEANLEVIENLAYIMARQAGEERSQEDWLDEFGPTDIYNAMAQIISVWTGSTETLSKAKKK